MNEEKCISTKSALNFLKLISEVSEENLKKDTESKEKKPNCFFNKTLACSVCIFEKLTNRWVYVEDALPEEDGRLLYVKTDKGEDYIATYDEKNGYFDIEEKGYKVILWKYGPDLS